jgi:hypothetical protein
VWRNAQAMGRIPRTLVKQPQRQAHYEGAKVPAPKCDYVHNASGTTIAKVKSSKSKGTAMLRSLIVASSLLVLAACATPRPAAEVSTLAQRTAESSDELECMADCLDDSTEDCESCANHCLTRVPGAAVASIFY